MSLENPDIILAIGLSIITIIILTTGFFVIKYWGPGNFEEKENPSHTKPRK